MCFNILTDVHIDEFVLTIHVGNILEEERSNIDALVLTIHVLCMGK